MSNYFVLHVTEPGYLVGSFVGADDSFSMYLADAKKFSSGAETLAYAEQNFEGWKWKIREHKGDGSFVEETVIPNGYVEIGTGIEFGYEQYQGKSFNTNDAEEYLQQFSDQLNSTERAKLPNLYLQLMGGWILYADYSHDLPGKAFEQMWQEATDGKPVFWNKSQWAKMFGTAWQAAFKSAFPKTYPGPIAPGNPSPWWNPGAPLAVTIGDTTIKAPNWGQDFEHATPLDFAMPSAGFPLGLSGDMMTNFFDSYGGLENFTRIYGTKLDTLEKFKNFKQNTSGFKAIDKYTFWLVWLLGFDIVVSETGEMSFSDQRLYYPLKAARIIDAWKYKFYKGRQPMAPETMPFCTGNYFGWDESYKNDSWFKLAVDTVTTWRFNDLNKIDLRAPTRFDYAPELFRYYSLYSKASGGLEIPNNQAEAIPGNETNSSRDAMQKLQQVFPDWGRKNFVGHIKWPTVTPLIMWNIWSFGPEYDVDKLGKASLASEYMAAGSDYLTPIFGLHYMIKYTPLSALPKPPFHTKESAVFQYRPNVLNFTRYINSVFEAGRQMDTGTNTQDIKIRLGYLPPMEKRDKSFADYALDVLATLASTVGVFLLAIYGVNAAIIKLKTFSAASMFADFSVTEMAKNWFRNKALALVTAEVTDELTEDEREAIEENQQAIQDAQEEAAREQEAIRQAQGEAAQAEQGADAARKQLTGTAIKSILAIGSALLLAKLGG